MIKRRRRGVIKRVIRTILIVLGVSLLLAHTSASHAQNAQWNTKEYVSSLWGFTLSISYPAEWVVRPLIGSYEVIHVSAPGPIPYPDTIVVVVLPPNIPTLEQSAKSLASALRRFDQNVKILNEKPSQLRNGAPAYEAELEWIKEGTRLNTLMLATMKERIAIVVYLNDPNGRIGEDLKKIVYSLEVKPEKE